MQADDRRDRPRQPPLQFRLRTLLIITAVFASLFATLEWLGVPALASCVILAILTVSVLAAIGLVVVIAHSVTEDGEEDEG